MFENFGHGHHMENCHWNSLNSPDWQKFLNCTYFRGVFKTQTNVYDGACLRKKNECLKAVNYFHKKSFIMDIWLGFKYIYEFQILGPI